ncbi:MAG: hypothetical protein LW724_03900 [Planctomycetaceae bacterium]|jgi:tetratricopeptide (TPR) repeat protein|nr:hypothetical protein [Planctomycetaceae bacterium]
MPTISSGSLSNKLIIALAICLPVVPVAADYFGPATRARWMLAQAANEFDRGNVDKAQVLLEAAYAKSPDLIEDKDFLRQVDRIEGDGQADGTSNLLTTLLEEKMRRIKDPVDRAETALLFSNLLSNRKQFDKAIRVLSENLPPQAQRTPTQNNQIAYMRALAGTDLELALSEIDTAIATTENDSLLDTKGWVLHRMGRNEEALETMDKSLAKLMESWSADSFLSTCLTKMNELQSQAGQQASEKPKGWGLEALLEEFPQFARRLPQIIDMHATLRYHRMRICEALGKTDQVHDEAAWIHAFSRKELDELY